VDGRVGWHGLIARIVEVQEHVEEKVGRELFASQVQDYADTSAFPSPS
jgi:hypothetical protein